MVVPVSWWDPPRGVRTDRGGWATTLLARPLPKRSLVESFAVENYRALISRFTGARDVAGVSLRSLAREAGLSLSALTSMEQGSSWSRLSTLRRAGAVVGLELLVQERAGGVVEALFAQMAEVEGLSRRGVATDAGLRPNTVYDLAAGTATDPAMSTVLAIAHAVGAQVEYAEA